MTTSSTDPAKASAKHFVLVVDDDALNRKVVLTLLRAEGHEVQCVNSGQEALEAIARRRPDLVLLDLMMPGMDGFEVVRRLRAQADGAQLPVVAVSAIDHAGARARLAAAGVTIINKPIDRWALKACVDHLLARGGHGDPQ